MNHNPVHQATRIAQRVTLGLLLIASPLLSQYYSNDLTPPNASSAKLNSASSGKQAGGGNHGHAVLLNGNALSAIDLHPSAAYSTSMATSTDDSQQCGYAYSTLSGGVHAMLWSGSSASAVDLHPSYTWSYCLGTHGGQQVGYGERPVYFTTYQEALLWQGTSASAINLHPLGYAYSKAVGVKNGQQVGYGSTSSYPYGDTIYYQAGSKALLWTGSAASVVSLHPLGYDASQALATNGTQQGGWAYLALGSSHLHAMLWSGTAESAIDLHPAGYTDSRITALNATQQVGDGWVGPPGQPGSIRQRSSGLAMHKASSI